MTATRRLRIPSRAWVSASKLVGRAAPSRLGARIARPHFMLSSGRSGTTMLNALFDLHPDVANYPSEGNELWHPRLYPWATSTVATPPYWLDPDEFTRRSLAQRTAADDAALRATLGAFQTLARAPVLLVKSVMVTFMIDELLAWFPDARFVHLYRDGRAVAASWLIKDRHKLDAPRAQAAGLTLSDDELLDAYLAYWQASIAAVEQADARHGLTASGRLHELTYEALCADPRGQLAALARFMGVAEAPFVEADLSAVRSSNRKSREQLGEGTKARLWAAAGETLRRRGYGEEIR
jgi:hypothetical protein